MSTAPSSTHTFRTWNKDVGVAVVVCIALALGYLLMQVVVNRTQTYQEPNSPFQIEYPKTWTNAESLQEVLLKVEDPAADSAFKTTLTVEARDLDPSAPPTLQTLVDRRVQQRSALTAYHFIANNATQVNGVPAQELQYTYVVQPIDTPRRVALPVVVVARDYIALTPTRSYYLTLAAPENEAARANEIMDRILQSVKLQ
ncbi:DUF1795 domain-containing protein [Anaerolineae bacterium CFX7]|nr:DUF1795 domain-containing protein [Anaerolineae bacterium CFX7]